MNIHLSKILRPDRCNATAICRKIEMATRSETLVWKDGIYPLSKPIIQNGKVHWQANGNTTLQATSETTLLTIGHAAHKSRIGEIKFKGSHSIYDKPENGLPGIIVSAIIRMTDVVVSNVPGNGITVSADLLAANTNASHARFDNIEVIECGGHGMYFQGGDANQCGVYHADVRDCGGIGFWDNSFLGLQLYSCMTHNNKGGSYKAGNHDNANPRTGFYGCYAEGGQGPIQLGGVACWYGGLPSDGIIVTQYAKVFTYDTVEIFKK